MRMHRWVILILLGISAVSLSPGLDHHSAYPLTEERRTVGVLATLPRLPVYGRVLHVTAHPDDESAATLTWLSRKMHVWTALFCLTRGEGGQNLLGSEKQYALGLIRTGELLQACRYYGAELYFGRALDFGFSKTAEEAFAKWGYETTLGDLVRFIRRWRPQVIISRFQGGPEDKHGHHQAVGILVKEAFRAAADPTRFSKQIQAGLTVWQAKKLYTYCFSGGLAQDKSEREKRVLDWTVRVPVGDYDPVLGRSYQEIAAEGYANHRTRGSGMFAVSPEASFEYFRLLESSVGTKPRRNQLLRRHR